MDPVENTKPALIFMVEDCFILLEFGYKVLVQYFMLKRTSFGSTLTNEPV